MREALVVPSSSWYMLALANMSTVMREWVALQSAHTLTCKQALLCSKARRPRNIMQGYGACFAADVEL